MDRQRLGERAGEGEEAVTLGAVVCMGFEVWPAVKVRLEEKDQEGEKENDGDRGDSGGVDRISWIL